VVLDHEYQKAVTFVNDVTEMPAVVAKLLSDSAKLSQLSLQSRLFIMDKVISLLSCSWLWVVY
jgi:hypothetical protein